MPTQHKSDDMSIEEKIEMLCKNLEGNGKVLDDTNIAFEKKISLD
jgi:hypothetical protein